MAVRCKLNADIIQSIESFDRKMKCQGGFNRQPFAKEEKSGKGHPDQSILFGQNLFTRDDIKRRIYVESREIPDGMLVKYQDILSYELIRDGKTIAGTPSAPAGNVQTHADNPKEVEDKIYCEELQLKIAIQNKLTPIILMPFIFFPVKNEADYQHALNAAMEMVRILEGILLQKAGEKAHTISSVDG